MANTFTQIVDNSSQILDAFKRQVENGLSAIGTKAEKHAKANTPVDTGRLRNSITFATSKRHLAGEAPAVPADYAAHGSPETGSVYIGTNVEYAPIIEYRDMDHQTGKAHFLRDAAANHNEEYKKTMETALKA